MSEIVKRHLITYTDTCGVESESWFEGIDSANQIACMLTDGSYVGMRVWPPPNGTIPVTDADLRERNQR